MGFSNVGLRGSRYWWRKKMTVAGVRLTLALPIGAMSFTDLRVRRTGMAVCGSAPPQTCRLVSDDRDKAQ
jgi:hypothetical protein